MDKKQAIKFLKSSRMYIGYQDEEDLLKIIELLEGGNIMEKIRTKIEEMIMKATEKNDLKDVAVLLELRLVIARIYSNEKS